MAAAAPAQTTGETWIGNLSTDRSVCNLKVAERVSFAELTQPTASLRQKCIAVDGYWNGKVLFVSEAAAQATSGQSLGDQIGLYGRDKLLKKAPPKARPFTAVGMVGDCKSLWNAAPMVLGYCHYYEAGPFIALSEMHRR